MAAPGAALAKPPAKLPRPQAQAGAALPVHLALEQAEAGLRLAARAERLSRDEAAKLRGEIAALLSRYGFSASQIMLNGETDFWSRERKN